MLSLKVRKQWSTYFGGQVDRELRGGSFQELAVSMNHRSRRGRGRTLLGHDFQRQSPNHMGRTEQKNYSHESVHGTQAYYNEYWALSGIVKSGSRLGGVEN